MVGKRDLIGTHINELQNRVCVQYATTVMRFKKHGIERYHHRIKTVDTSYGYTLIASDNAHGLIGCHNSFAVFTLLEQNPVKKKQGLLNLSCVLLSVKCEYINLRGQLTTYLFQILAEHDVCNEGYFYQIDVNKNGSLLLLTSPSEVYVVRVPAEMDEDSVLHDPSTLTFLYNHVLRAEVMHCKKTRSKQHAQCKVVKAAFHQNYANTICIMTMELKQGQDPATGDTIDQSETPKTHGVASDSAAVLNQFDHEMMGVLRIFNVEQSIDTPYVAMELSEGMCRTGEIDAVYDANAAPRGAVVDFCWNADGGHTWGDTSVFIMSNYGIVFVYCPVLMPNCLGSFKHKQHIVDMAQQLMMEGYRMKAAPQMNCLETAEDVSLLFDSLASRYVPNDADENMVKILPTIFKLETSDEIGRNCFETLAVMNTEPHLEVIVTVSNGKLVLYQSSTCVKPLTSHFYRPGAKLDITYLNYAATENSVNQRGRRTLLIRVSDRICIAHSAAQTRMVTVEDGNMQIRPIAHMRITGDHVYTHSQPLVVTGEGHKNAYHASKNNQGYHSSKFYMFQASYCYLLAHEELKHFKTTVALLPLDDEHTKVKIALTDIPQLESSSSAPRLSVINLGDGNTILNGNEGKSSVQKIRNYASEAEATYLEAFKTARELVTGAEDYRNKTVGLVKQLETIDTKAMLQLKTRINVEDTVQESIQAYSGVHSSISKMLETLPIYRQKVEELKTRAEHLRKLNDELRERRNRVMLLERELQQHKTKEIEVQHLADLITNVYLRCSERLCKSITYKVNQPREQQSYKECVKRVVDEWLTETLKSNIEAMEQTFARIRDLRNRIIELN
ncbi:dynein heavy chain, putative [Babesia ovis]|uniref:Dynein heavy chain, putative n=1 Tax=Babesia ovis TaxID=5869 RepID=A0A9W5TA65_BABOV|nr:dynein heavy chain, putative [Babesia ovis]